jgi:hypothetical protein
MIRIGWSGNLSEEAASLVFLNFTIVLDDFIASIFSDETRSFEKLRILYQTTRRQMP